MELENIQTVASLCCGVIGYSWALKFAMGGHEVYAYNRSEESSARAKQRVKESMDSLKKNGVYTDSEAEKILSRIHYTTSLEEAVKNALFIQESSAEHYEVKHALVKEIEAPLMTRLHTSRYSAICRRLQIKPSASFCSTTGSLPTDV